MSLAAAAVLVRSLVRTGPWCGPDPVVLLGFLQDGSPEGLFPAPPLQAVFEEMFAGLDLVLTPAFGIWPSRRPLEILACEAMFRLQLVEPRRESLIGSSHGWVRLLLARMIFAVHGPVGPRSGVRPLCFRELNMTEYKLI